MAAPKLLDQVRMVARLRHLSLKTEKAYVQQNQALHLLSWEATPE